MGWEVRMGWEVMWMLWFRVVDGTRRDETMAWYGMDGILM